jgi:hypothetical protein
MAYKQTEFIKQLNGVKAPRGFHYMSNGKLMSDADHVAMYGYIPKTIQSLDMDLSDIDNDGERRMFTINGDDGSYFSLKVYTPSSPTVDATVKYYDFYESTWSTSVTGLRKIRLTGGSYVGYINFPAETSSLISYSFDLIAETTGNHKTSHTSYVEVRNLDNSVNINKSTGSNSSLLRKVLYQDVAKTLTLSIVAPSLYDPSTNTLDGAVSSGTKFIVDNSLTNKTIALGDLVTSTNMTLAEYSLVTAINPDGDNVKEFSTSIANSESDGVTLTFTPVFRSITPHYTDSTTGADVIPTFSGASFSSGFSITVAAPTGRSLVVNRLPNTEDLCAIQTVTFGNGLAIRGENTSSDSVFYRFPATNIVGLSSGMFLDPSRASGGTNTSTPAVISSYRATQEATSVIESAYSSLIKKSDIVDIEIDGVDPAGNDITTVDRNGRPTAQAGNIVFNRQQVAALTGDTSKIYAYGSSQIEKLTGMKVNVRDVEIEDTLVSTTLTSGCDNSVSVALTEVSGISIGATVKGAGIASSAVNPTVVKKSTRSGNGTVTLSVAQTIENGQTLYFSPGVQTFTIKGVIDVESMAIANTKLYFDIERFVTGQ